MLKLSLFEGEQKRSTPFCVCPFKWRRGRSFKSVCVCVCVCVCVFSSTGWEPNYEHDYLFLLIILFQFGQSCTANRVHRGQRGCIVGHLGLQCVYFLVLTIFSFTIGLAWMLHFFHISSLNVFGVITSPYFDRLFILLVCIDSFCLLILH